MAASATTTAVIRAPLIPLVRAPSDGTRHSRHRTMIRATASRWSVALASLAALRVAIPLLVLAAAGHDLPGLPPYDYTPLNGDATGFYAESRELISVAFGPAGAVAVLLLCCGSVVGVAAPAGLEGSRSRLVHSPSRSPRPPSCSARCRSGAAVVGWPLLWAIPLLPVPRARPARRGRRLRGWPSDPRSPRTRVTVVATAYIGLRASGRRWIGVAAAALLRGSGRCWRGSLAGPSAWENGQWNVDVGLHLYTEPLSTALVAVGDRDPARPAARRASARRGRESLLGYATVGQGLRTASSQPRPSRSSPIGSGARRALPFAAGRARVRAARRGVLAKGLSRRSTTFRGSRSTQADHAAGAPTRCCSTRGRLRVLLPLAVLGTLAAAAVDMRRCSVAAIATNAGLYTFYEHTHLHPRFLYVVAAGALRARGRGRLVSDS